MEDSMAQIGRFMRSATTKIKEQASEFIERSTPLEKQLKEATSNTNWGCATSLLGEIARASYDYNDFFVIMKYVWDGISDKPSRWRRVFKSLTLLEYLILNGSERIVDEARESICLHRIRKLVDLHYTDKGVDKGAGIRKKSKDLYEMINDADKLHQEREKASRTREKFVGIGPRGQQSRPTHAFSSDFERSYDKRYDPWEPRGVAGNVSRSGVVSGRDQVLKEQEDERQRADQQRELGRKQRERQKERTRMQRQKEEDGSSKKIKPPPGNRATAYRRAQKDNDFNSSSSFSSGSVSGDNSSSDLTPDRRRDLSSSGSNTYSSSASSSRGSSRSSSESSSAQARMRGKHSKSKSSDVTASRTQSKDGNAHSAQHKGHSHKVSNLLEFDAFDNTSGLTSVNDAEDWSAFASAPPKNYNNQNFASFHTISPQQTDVLNSYGMLRGSGGPQSAPFASSMPDGLFASSAPPNSLTSPMGPMGGFASSASSQNNNYLMTRQHAAMSGELKQDPSRMSINLTASSAPRIPQRPHFNQQPQGYQSAPMMQLRPNTDLLASHGLSTQMTDFGGQPQQTQQMQQTQQTFMPRGPSPNYNIGLGNYNTNMSQSSQFSSQMGRHPQFPIQ